MSIFNEATNNLIPTLEKFVPIVARVHGEHHPEFHDVRKYFEIINGKLKGTGTETFMLGEEFAKLREITDNYTVPDDVCESYEAVYKMLAELDEAYNKQETNL